MKEFPDVGWKLLLTLLPGQVRASSYTHKPTWRKVVPKDWKGSVSQKDYWSQVSIYAEMAIEAAQSDLTKLRQLVENLDHLPRPLFERLLAHLQSDTIAGRSEDEKLGIWTSLVELGSKHRRFAEADWALPNEAVSKIEEAARALAPKDIRSLNRRLFSGRDWDLYEEKGNWQEQEKKLQQRRQEVIQEILSSLGTEAVLAYAHIVDSPQQVGIALGSFADDKIDALVLPSLLNAEDKKLADFSAGYVWAKYRAKGWAWVDGSLSEGWSKADIGRFLILLPFDEETWKRAAKLLPGDSSDYWKNVPVNPYQPSGDLGIAIDKLIEYDRPWAAIDCIAKTLHDKLPVDKARAVRALLNAASSKEGSDLHDAIELIKALQDAKDTSEEDLFKVEWTYLRALDGNLGAKPKYLETRMARDPEFFSEVIRAAYRSTKESQEAKTEPTEERKALAENAWRLLREWENLPGIDDDGKFSGDSFKKWVEFVVKSTTESGHLEMSLHQIGAVLLRSPSDPSGLWMHRAVAEVLNAAEYEELRKGYSSAIYNSRGVHWVDPTGKPEKELAAKYGSQADQIENAGFQRIAATLREVAESYEREAERVVAEHKDEAEEEKDS